MMNPMRAPMVMLCTAVVFAAPLTSCSRPGDLVLGPTVSAPRASGPVQRLSQPQQKAVAGPVDPDNRIGAIFIDNGPLHVCTGSVVGAGLGKRLAEVRWGVAGKMVAACPDGIPMIRWLDISGRHLIFRPNQPSREHPLIPMELDDSADGPILGQVVWSWSRFSAD